MAWKETSEMLLGSAAVSAAVRRAPWPADPNADATFIA